MTDVTGWRKPSRSETSNACVEVGRTAEGDAAVQDSKDRSLGYFTANAQQWTNFVSAIKADRFTS